MWEKTCWNPHSGKKKMWRILPTEPPEKASSQRLWLGCIHLPHCNLRGAPALLNNLQKSKVLCHENQYVIQCETSFVRCHQLKESMGSQREAGEVCVETKREQLQFICSGVFKIIKIDSNVSCGFWSRSPEAVGGAGGFLRWDLKWKLDGWRGLNRRRLCQRKIY